NVSQVLLDGNNVTSSVVVTKSGGQTLGTYTQGPFFASGSKHTVSVTWQTSLGQTLSVSGMQFTVISYLNLPAAMAVSSGSVALTRAGFFIKAYQTADGNPNRAYWTDEQLEGLHGTNGIDFSSVAGATNGNMVAWSGAIDFANGSSGGQFGINTPWTTLGI